MSAKRLWLMVAGLGLLLALLACGFLPPGEEQGATPVGSPTAESGGAEGGGAPTPTMAPSAEATETPTPTSTPTPSATATPTAAVGGGGATATPEATAVPLCPDLELEIEFHQIQSMNLGETTLNTEIIATGRVPLTLDAGAAPPAVRGEGELPISGGGQVGDCSFQYSGTLAYRFEGEVVPDPQGAPELHLGGQRAMTIKASAPCGGGGAAPFEEMGEQVLPYQEGATVEWTWGGMAGVEGSSRWVLHILCGE